MKILKGKYGECRFCDNMDEEHGLPSLEEKSWDLCLTDYPFNINISAGTTFNKDKIFYKDDIDFETKTTSWFNQIIKIGNGVSIYGMKKHLSFFYQFNPKDLVIIVKKNTKSGGSISHWQRCNFLLFWGQFQNKLKEDYFITYVENGFLRQGDLNHPCPIPYNFWFDLINQLKPKSILEPFMGSGTTAEVCESLGIPWLGYELMEEYAPDIEKRIQRGITKKKYATKQQKLM